MKFLYYLLFAKGIASTQSIVKIVDQASNTTQPFASTYASTTTPQSANSLASLSGTPADEDTDGYLNRLTQPIDALEVAKDLGDAVLDLFGDENV